MGARTIRKKITEKLPQYLTDFPPLPAAPSPHPSASLRAECTKPVDWAAVDASLTVDRSVAEVDWCVLRAGRRRGAAARCYMHMLHACDVGLQPSMRAWCRGLSDAHGCRCVPGTKAGLAATKEFCQSRLKLFADKRNDPNACQHVTHGCSLERLRLRPRCLQLQPRERVAAVSPVRSRR